MRVNSTNTVKQTKLAGIIILLGMVLISTTYTNKLLGANQDTLYRSIKIKLKDYYGKKQLRELNKELWDAAIKGVIIAYKNDSFNSFYEPEELLRSGSDCGMLSYYDSNGVLIDTVLRNEFNLDNINTYSISIRPWHHPESNNIELVFTGFSLNYDFNAVIFKGKQLIDSLPPIYSLPLFYISKGDFIKLLGKKVTAELFNNCYKAMLYNINSDKNITIDSTTSFNADMSHYLGEYTLDDLNKKMFNAVTKGLPGTNKLIPAYKTANFNTTYTLDEALGRGYTMEMVQIPTDVNDPNSDLVDTAIKVDFKVEGNKSYSLTYKWSYDPVKSITIADISGFGLYVPMVDNERKMNHETLFWIKWNDAIKIYSPLEIAMLRYAFYNAIINFQDSDLK